MTIACVGLFAKAKIVTYPVPLSEKAFTSYKVSVNGIPVDCYKAQSPQYLGGEYYFCYFDFEGDVKDLEVKNVISELENGSDKFVFLGAYKELI